MSRSSAAPIRATCSRRSPTRRSDVPISVMTYANIVRRPGLASFCEDAAAAGVAGLIVPDLPVDEAAELEALAAARAIDVVLLAAPGTTSERYAAIGAASRGFVYCVATYGVTGVRGDAGSDRAGGRRRRCGRPRTCR